MNLSYLKCCLVALGGTFFPLATQLFTKDKGYAEIIKDEYLGDIKASLVGSTLPAAVANVIDTYGHQYVSSNKYVQYGLTALEGIVLSFVTYQNREKSFSQNITETFSELIELSITYDSLMTKAVVLGAAAQAVAFKYILSDSEEKLQLS